MTTGIYTNTGYHDRRSIRLHGYDYSRAGMYFITLCIHDHAQFVFGNIVGATGASPISTGVSPQMGNILPTPHLELNEYGSIVRDEWERTFKIRPELIMDEYVIMPDHMHAIVCIRNHGDNKTGEIKQGDTPVAPTGPKPRSIGAMIAGFKSGTIKRINELRNAPGGPVWQRNYFEHIVRNEQSLFRIRQYIRNNPENWVADAENHLENEIKRLDMNQKH